MKIQSTQLAKDDNNMNQNAHWSLQQHAHRRHIVYQIDHISTLYWSAIVTIALSCTIFELFDAQNIVTLKSRLGVIEGHWKWHHSIDRIGVPILLPL